MTTEKPAPTLIWKLLCTLSALFLGALGLLAIVSETHSGYARGQGAVTLLGGQAIAMGCVLICMALFPLVAWLPRRWVGWSLVAWWLLLMVTIFQGIYQPF